MNDKWTAEQIASRPNLQKALEVMQQAASNAFETAQEVWTKEALLGEPKDSDSLFTLDGETWTSESNNMAHVKATQEQLIAAGFLIVGYDNHKNIVWVSNNEYDSLLEVKKHQFHRIEFLRAVKPPYDTNSAISQIMHGTGADGQRIISKDNGITWEVAVKESAKSLKNKQHKTPHIPINIVEPPNFNTEPQRDIVSRRPVKIPNSVKRASILPVRDMKISTSSWWEPSKFYVDYPASSISWSYKESTTDGQ